MARAPPPAAGGGPWHARVRSGGALAPAPPPPAIERWHCTTHTYAFVQRGRDGHACTPLPPLPPECARAYVARVRLTSAYSTYPAPLLLACPPADGVAVVPPHTWQPAEALLVWTHPVGSPAVLAAKWAELQRARATLADDVLEAHATPDGQWYALPAREPAARLLRVLLGDDALPAVHRDVRKVLRSTVGEARAALAALQQRYFAPHRAPAALPQVRVGHTPELDDALAACTPAQIADCVLSLTLEFVLLEPREDAK